MEKMRMESLDMTAQNIEKIGALFPNCVTETTDEDGKLRKAINFDILRQMLSGDVVEGDEAYEFTWVGKKAAIIEANTPIRRTLRPCPAESKDWDTTENLYIEGDNLEVLKLLQESYLGRIKMIYIDPPYNTGHDFIYNDTFARSQYEEDLATGAIDEETGDRLYQNKEANGRFHSAWCSMIYPRLLLSRNLLSEDGVIFISIDDHEVDNLQKICGEVFGESNFLSLFCWQTDGNFDNQAKIKTCHQYILMYAKHADSFPAPPVIDPNIPETSKLYKTVIRNTIVKNGPKNPISTVEIPVGFPCDFHDGVVDVSKVDWPKYNQNVIVCDNMLSSGVSATSGWASKGQLLEFIANGFQPVTDTKGQATRFVITKTGAIEAIKDRSDSQSHVISLLQNLGGSQKASASLGTLSTYFDFPKPVELIKYLLQMNYGDDFICLDFFGGSSTTAHAVMELNVLEGKQIKYILVQLPEKTAMNTAAYNAGFKNICEIGKERIRKSGEKIKESAPLTNTALDIGFRVLKVDDSNMNDVFYSADMYSQDLLSSMESNIKTDRTELDLLFGCLLEWGLSLSEKFAMFQIDGVNVYAYGMTAEEYHDYKDHMVTYQDGVQVIDCQPEKLNAPLVACFAENVPDAVIKRIAKMQPLRAVFRDSCFADSPSKINVFEIFKMLAPDTRVKVI